MAASAYFPVWKSLRVFRITWLYFLISGDNFLCELLPSDKYRESDEESHIPSFQ